MKTEIINIFVCFCDSSKKNLFEESARRLQFKDFLTKVFFLRFSVEFCNNQFHFTYPSFHVASWALANATGACGFHWHKEGERSGHIQVC